MANIEVLKEKVAKAKTNVEKRKATIVRHENQLEKKLNALIKRGYDVSDLKAIKGNFGESDVYWEVNDVEKKLDDIKGAEKKLKEAETILANWQGKLDVELEKERFLNDEAPQVILDFLNDWKQKAYEWHIKRYEDFLIFAKKLREEEEELRKSLQGLTSRREQREKLKEHGLDFSSIEQRKRQFAGATVLRMAGIYDEEQRLKWLESVLEEERKAKMLDLINRINTVVGAITDASKLEVNEKGNLDGFITGEKGKAKIETVGAGGWNIQCFHYRTLVHKVE